MTTSRMFSLAYTVWLAVAMSGCDSIFHANLIPVDAGLAFLDREFGNPDFGLRDKEHDCETSRLLSEFYRRHAGHAVVAEARCDNGRFVTLISKIDEPDSRYFVCIGKKLLDYSKCSLINVPRLDSLRSISEVKLFDFTKEGFIVIGNTLDFRYCDPSRPWFSYYEMVYQGDALDIIPKSTGELKIEMYSTFVYGASYLYSPGNLSLDGGTLEDGGQQDEVILITYCSCNKPTPYPYDCGPNLKTKSLSLSTFK